MKAGGLHRTRPWRSQGRFRKLRPGLEVLPHRLMIQTGHQHRFPPLFFRIALVLSASTNGTVEPDHSRFTSGESNGFLK
jgi:hypothetical protein